MKYIFYSPGFTSRATNKNGRLVMQYTSNPLMLFNNNESTIINGHPGVELYHPTNLAIGGQPFSVDDLHEAEILIRDIYEQFHIRFNVYKVCKNDIRVVL